MSRCAAILVLAGFAVPGAGQERDAPAGETPTSHLTLPAAGPPAPSFRYELLPGRRDQVAGNAALLHHRALHILADHRPPAAEYVPTQEKLGKALDGPTASFPKEEVRTFLRAFGGVFREVEAAAKCDHCDWGIEQRAAAEGIGLLLNDAQKMRELAFLLRLRSRLHLADGKFELALRDLQTGLALARHATQGPTLIHFLIGNSIATSCLGDLEKIMQAPGCPNLYWSLTALPRPLLDLRKGMEGEIRIMESTIPIPKDVDKGPMTPEEALAALDRIWNGIVKLSEESNRPGVAQSRLGLAFVITLQHPSARKALLASGRAEAELDAMPPAQVVMLDALVRFRNLRDEHFVWFNAPYAEAMQGMAKSDEKARAVRRSPPFDYLQSMLLLLLPGVDKIYGAQVRLERRVASLRCLEAVRLQAAKNDGQLPAKLNDVNVVPVPVDPTTNKPFEYSVADNTFTIAVPAPPGSKPDRGNHWKYVVTIVK